METEKNIPKKENDNEIKNKKEGIDDGSNEAQAEIKIQQSFQQSLLVLEKITSQIEKMLADIGTALQECDGTHIINLKDLIDHSTKLINNILDTLEPLSSQTKSKTEELANEQLEQELILEFLRIEDDKNYFYNNKKYKKYMELILFFIINVVNRLPNPTILVQYLTARYQLFTNDYELIYKTSNARSNQEIFKSLKIALGFDSYLSGKIFKNEKDKKDIDIAFLFNAVNEKLMPSFSIGLSAQLLMEHSSLIPYFSPEDQRIKKLKQQALQLFGTGDYKKANLCFAGLVRNTLDVDINLYYALSLMANADFTKALEYFNLTLYFDKHNVIALFSRSLVFENFQLFEEALHDMEIVRNLISHKNKKIKKIEKHQVTKRDVKKRIELLTQKHNSFLTLAASDKDACLVEEIFNEDTNKKSLVLIQNKIISLQDYLQQIKRQGNALANNIKIELKPLLQQIEEIISCVKKQVENETFYKNQARVILALRNPEWNYKNKDNFNDTEIADINIFLLKLLETEFETIDKMAELKTGSLFKQYLKIFVTYHFLEDKSLRDSFRQKVSQIFFDKKQNPELLTAMFGELDRFHALRQIKISTAEESTSQQCVMQ